MLKLWILVFFFALLSCTSQTLISSTENSAPLELLQQDSLGFIDARARFREIFCAVLNEHGSNLPDYDLCANSLRSIAQEPRHISTSVNLDAADKEFIIGLVPGVGWQCVRHLMNNDNSGPQHLLTQGFDVRLFEVGGLSGSQNNAQQINNTIMALPEQDKQRPVILIGYSKGAADILYAIAKYPQLQKRVVAVVSVAGAIGGSPLADNTRQSHLNLLAYIPMSGCDFEDEKAIESLHTETRKKWLENNPLPENIRYYSIISYPETEKISFGLKSAYQQLAAVDPRNDGQLIFYHQLIPASKLLAFVNADHWAMSIPVARQIYLNRLTFANKNEYPREVLLEAILRYVEEDLSKPQ